MTEQEVFERTLALIVVIMVAGTALWFAFIAIRGGYRYYRDCKPKQMATRITRKPFDDDRSSQRNFDRIIGRR